MFYSLSTTFASTALLFLSSHSTEANLMQPIGLSKPTESWATNSGEAVPNTAGKIASSEEQLKFLAPINLPEGTIKSKAIPTNVWWGNLISQDTNGMSHPIYSNPYRIEMELDTTPFGIHICYAYQYRAFGPQNENGAAKYYIHGMGIQDLTLGASEFTTKPTVSVTDWDASGLGVTAVMTPAGEDGSRKLTSTFVNGMAFITATYDNLTPELSSQHAITSINGDSSSTVVVSGTKFVIALNNGQTWVVYSSASIRLQKDGSTLVGADGQVSNVVLRAALLPSSDAPNTNVYDKYSTCTVTGASLNIPSSTSYEIEWNTTGDSCSSVGALHFALEHHTKAIDSTDTNVVADDNIVLHSTTRGLVRGYVSTSRVWKFKEDDSVDIGFYPPRSPDAATVSQYKIKETLQDEINAEWSLPTDGSYYFTGKLAQKYASLCLMSADSAVNTDASLTSTCIAKLQAEFEKAFLTNEWEHPLIYDEIFRGISSSEAFNVNDKWIDFGNSMFNDHHYHYGYWIVASAMLRHLDPTWSRMNELEGIVNLLVRDAANPSTEDEWFPLFRHFDWFAGHSYSHGVSPFADGKDQESTSEEMNFHYGLMLWGSVSNNDELADLGRLMLKVNKRSINTYFLMDDDNVVHPPEFIKNKVTGIFFDNKVDYATWFCGDRHCIHGIQMIPVSPINEMYRTEAFVSQEWNQVLTTLPLIDSPEDNETPWQSLLFANGASVEKTRALENLVSVPMDDGLSRAWALYYAATRPGEGTVVNPGVSDIIGSSDPVPVPSTTPAVTPYPSPEPPVYGDDDTPPVTTTATPAYKPVTSPPVTTTATPDYKPVTSPPVTTTATPDYKPVKKPKTSPPSVDYIIAPEQPPSKRCDYKTTSQSANAYKKLRG